MPISDFLLRLLFLFFLSVRLHLPLGLLSFSFRLIFMPFAVKKRETKKMVLLADGDRHMQRRVIPFDLLWEFRLR